MSTRGGRGERPLGSTLLRQSGGAKRPAEMPSTPLKAAAAKAAQGTLEEQVSRLSLVVQRLLDAQAASDEETATLTADKAAADAKIAELEAAIAALSERVQKLEGDYMEMPLTSMQEQQSTHTQQLADLAEQQESITGKYDALTTQVMEISTTVADLPKPDAVMTDTSMSSQLDGIVQEIKQLREVQQQREQQQKQQEEVGKQELRKRSLFFRLLLKEGSNALTVPELTKALTGSIDNLSPAAIETIFRIKQKDSPLNYAEAAAASSSKPAAKSSSKKAAADSSSNSNQPMQSALYRITLARASDARKVLLLKAKLREAHGLRVEEVLSPEELLRKKAYISSGIREKLWTEGKVKSDWRRGELVMWDTNSKKWVPVALPTASAVKA